MSAKVGAPSTTRTCDLLGSCGKKGVNRGQRETAAPMFSVVRQSPETTRKHLEPPRIVCRLSVVRPSGSGDPVGLFLNFGYSMHRLRSTARPPAGPWCTDSPAPAFLQMSG